MERKIKLIPYRVYKHCPKCPGIMEASTFGVLTSSGISTLNMTITTNPSFTMSGQTFNHKCNKCGHGDNYDKNYPYIDYIEDGDLG